MIRLKNICKSFGDKKVLDNICADIPEKGIFAICGESGCGKTTLMRIICSLETPDSGEIENLKNKKLSVVFQEDRLLPWCTALENVSIVSDKETAKTILTRVELQNDMDKKPKELSGGMCRRVSLARALAFSGDVLLLDEPFKGLDRALKLRIFKLIENFSKEHCVILITHDEEEIASAQNILRIK